MATVKHHRLQVSLRQVCRVWLAAMTLTVLSLVMLQESLSRDDATEDPNPVQRIEQQRHLPVDANIVKRLADEQRQRKLKGGLEGSMFVLDWWMLPAGADVVQPQPLQLGPENLRVLQQILNASTTSRPHPAAPIKQPALGRSRPRKPPQNVNATQQNVNVTKQHVNLTQQNVSVTQRRLEALDATTPQSHLEGEDQMAKPGLSELSEQRRLYLSQLSPVPKTPDPSSVEQEEINSDINARGEKVRVHTNKSEAKEKGHSVQKQIKGNDATGKEQQRVKKVPVVSVNNTRNFTTSPHVAHENHPERIENKSRTENKVVKKNKTVYKVVNKLQQNVLRPFDYSQCRLHTRVIHMEEFSLDNSHLTKLLYQFALRHCLDVLPFNDLTNVTDHVTSHMIHHELPTNVSGYKFHIIAKQFILGDDSITAYAYPDAVKVMSFTGATEHFLSVLGKVKYRHRRMQDVVLPASFLTSKLVVEQALLKHGQVHMGPSHLLNLQEERWLKNSVYKQLGFVQRYDPEPEHIFTDNLLKLRSKINLFFRTSRFDESLVRLRRRLCWSLLDVLHLEHPADPMGSTDLQGSTAFQKVDANLRRWSELNYRVEENMDMLSEPTPGELSVTEEVWHFREVNRKVQEFCYSKNGTSMLNVEVVLMMLRRELRIGDRGDVLPVAASVWNPAFEVRRMDCVLMSLDVRLLRTLHRVRVVPYLCSRRFLQQSSANRAADLRRHHIVFPVNKYICELSSLLRKVGDGETCGR